MNESNILITGASGFIGATLNDLVSAYTPTHRRLDLTNYIKVKQYFKDHSDIDLTVHCAVAPPKKHEDRASDEEYGQKIIKDIAMASNILKFSPRTIILTTGAAKHSDNPDVGWSADVISRLSNSFAPKVLELRPFGVYGPGEDPKRFPSYCFKQITHNEPICVTKDRLMSWIYVDDLCEIIAHFTRVPWHYQWMDVVMPQSKSMTEIANMCMGIARTKVELIVEGTGPDYVGNPLYLYDEIPQIHFTTWDEGLRRLYETTIF